MPVLPDKPTSNEHVYALQLHWNFHIKILVHNYEQFEAFKSSCLLVWMGDRRKMNAMNAVMTAAIEANGIADAARNLSSISTIRIIHVKWHLKEEEAWHSSFS